MAYRLPLLNIKNMRNDDFDAMPKCDPNVIRLREPSKIKDNQSYLFELCRDISPSRDDSSRTKRAFPRYIPIEALYRGGDGFVMSAIDQWRQGEELIIKVPWPYSKHDGEIETTSSVSVQPEKLKIEKSASGMRQVEKSLFRRLIPPRKKEKTPPPEVARTKEEIEESKRREHEIKKSRHYERFHRAFMFQEQAHRKSRVIDKSGQLGYVPKTYEFSYDPHCYMSMEYITDAITYIEWIRTHTIQENMELFIKVLTFVRMCFHDMDIAHCDLNVQSNILVRGGVPIFLDFGIAKGEHLPTITMKGEQLGTPENASPEQMEDASERGPIDDIFSCGRILWTTLSGKRPPVSVVPAQIDTHGKVLFDHDLLQGLFAPSEIPEEYREIFKRTWNNGYAEIIDFQRDIEEVLYLGNAPSIIDSELSERVMALELKVNQLQDKLKKFGGYWK